jgi:4-hydroxy-tetrahydrodipicolinate synthase
LEAHLADQAAGGIDSILVGGTMGVMQMLTDQVWQELAEQSISLGAGRFEVLVGVGDTSYARTRGRIEYLNSLKGISGVVTLAPYFLPLSQAELIDYFESLAEVSKKPLYLYDLPGLTGVHLQIPTVCRLAAHPNIAGIKCSGELHSTRRLIDTVDSGFRVIVARPEMVDITIRHGIREHLDGVFALCPHWVTSIGAAAQAGRWHEAAKWQQKMNALREAMLQAGVWGGFTTIMNARGIPGRFAPRPIQMLNKAEQKQLLEHEDVATLLREPVMSGS